MQFSGPAVDVGQLTRNNPQSLIASSTIVPTARSQGSLPTTDQLTGVKNASNFTANVISTPDRPNYLTDHLDESGQGKQQIENTAEVKTKLFCKSYAHCTAHGMELRLPQKKYF